jgi:hypothetical protein
MRSVILAVSLVFIGGFAVLTLYVVAHSGADFFTILSLLVLAVLGFGVIGAFRQPPPPGPPPPGSPPE